MEMVEFPVMDRKEPASIEGFNPIVGKEFTTRFIPVRVLSPGENYVFRAKRVPDVLPADVLEWPSARNDWKMSLRVRPGYETPSKHALELQVSFEGADMLPVVGGAEAGAGSAADPNAPKVRVGIKTSPPGATVYIDGILHRSGNKAELTPCVVRTTAGTHTLKIRKYGYIDIDIRDFEATDERVVSVVMREDTSLVDKTIPVSARTSWQNSGVKVNEGDLVLVTATGTWACGSKREEVGPRGYPNDKRFFEYYLNPALSPRQLAGYNYGALLMRIGEDGKIQHVGEQLRVRADAAGALYFDINEADDGRARRDNTGAVNVRIRTAPSGR
jgi:hypothetical protein